MTPLPKNPFLADTQLDHRPGFVLDECAFMLAIEQAPLFIRNPSPEFQALHRELAPIVAACARK